MVDSEEDFEVFDRPDIVESSNLSPRSLPFDLVSSNQETANVLEAIVLQRKNSRLLELLESHKRGSTLKVAVHPWPPTPFRSCTSPGEPSEKKRKKEKKERKHLKRAKSLPLKTLSPRKGRKLLKGHKEELWQRA